jgi:hypothetical protein
MALTGREQLTLLTCGATLAFSSAFIVKTLLEQAPTSPLGSLAMDLVIPSRAIRLPDGLSCEVYVPPHLDPAQQHPLVFASSPSGTGKELLQVWKDACDRFQWILVASSNFRNGPYRATLESFGWRVDWIEFAGGHAYAPPQVYVEAAAWLAKQ